MLVRICDACGNSMNDDTQYEIKYGKFESGASEGKPAKVKQEFCPCCFVAITKQIDATIQELRNGKPENAHATA